MTVVGSYVCGHRFIHVVEKFRHVGKVEVSTWFRGNRNIFAQTFGFAVVGLSKGK